jgi:hypothetical protein
VRLALKVVIQNDGDYVEVILRYPLNKRPSWPQIRSRHIAEHNTSPLRRIFGPRRDKVTGEWRKLHNEELNDLTKYCSGDKIEKNEMGGACSAYGGGETRVQGFGRETLRKDTTWDTQE